MPHPVGRYKAKIIAASPTASQNGDPQLQVVFKTEYGTITNWMRFGGERGDQHIDIGMRQLAVAGLPDEDLSQYEKIIGYEGLIEVKQSDDGRYTNASIVDPDYVPQARPYDPLEWKKLAARMKKPEAPRGYGRQEQKKNDDPDF